MRGQWLVGAISMSLGLVGCPQPIPPVRPPAQSVVVEPPVVASEKPPESKSSTDGIGELEKFLQRQDLSPSVRAQTMFRLAALKEEQARQTAADSGLLDLGPSIELYQRIIRDHFDQDFLPSIHYFLGHALKDSGRAEEAQQVFRALVCRNHFTFVPSADSKAPVNVQRLPQDHDAAFWTAWETRHPRPPARAPKLTNVPNHDETVFANPYPEDCLAMEQKTGSGDAKRFIGEVWWLIGDYHFAQLDNFAGPYNFNRAVVAYKYALRHGSGQVQTLARYKLAWTYFKQQRYAAAIDQFVDLLRHVEADKNSAGISGVDLRKEAYPYIAASLAYVDFQGPGPDEPYIVREDVLDTEKDPRRAEKIMRIGIERLQYGKIVPQNEPWTADIYAAVVDEYRELMQFQNMIEVGEIFVAKWPTHSRAQEIRTKIDEAKGRLGRP